MCPGLALVSVLHCWVGVKAGYRTVGEGSMGELRTEGPEKEGKGGTLKEGPRGCCKRLCFSEWVLRVVLSWCLKLLEGPASPICLNLYSRHTSSHCGTWYPLAYYLRKSALPETCFLLAEFADQFGRMTRTSDSNPLAAQAFQRFPTDLQSASSGFQTYQQ